MKQVFLCFSAAIVMCSCATQHKIGDSPNPDLPVDTPITQSLFTDKSATISEEGIQKILDGSYKLPQQLRVAVVRLTAPNSSTKRYLWYGAYNDETYLKTQQAYLDLFTEKLKQSARVAKVSVVPDLLVPQSPSFTVIREAAVRMQADVVVVYAVNSDLYSKYRLFSSTDLKAYATTQLIMLDVRTGLIPFSSTVTKDFLSKKTKEDMGIEEAQSRVQNEAVLLTIQEMGNKLTAFLSMP